MNEEISLPVSKKNLASFITSLLGQPQNIQREIFGQFDIEHSWILNLVYLLQQRVLNQNDSQLIEFSIQVGFSNDSKRSFNSLKEFEHYNEVKKLETSNIKIVISFLVSFPNKNIPEKQEISISIEKKSPVSKSLGFPLESYFNDSTGRISYNIFYTERSWGDDIDHLISNEIDKKIIEKKKINYLLKIALGIISIFFSYTVMLMPLFNSEKFIQNKKKILLDSLPKDHNLITNDLKIDYLFKLSTIEIESKTEQLIISFFGIFLSIVVLFLYSYLLKKEGDCYIVLTDYDSIIRKKRMDKRLIQKVVLVVTYTGTILTGIFTNYLYDKLKILNYF